MKVAILTHYWRTSKGGGINTYLTEVVRLLESKTKINIIFTYGEDKNNLKLFEKKIIFRRFIAITDAYIKLLRIKPNVIHVHESFELLISAALYRIFHKDIRLVYTFHTEPSNPISLIKIIRKKIQKYPYQWGLNQCDCVTFVSKGLKEIIVEITGLKFNKTDITYAGVKAKQVSENDIKEFCGRFNIRKESLILLIQAFTANPLKAEGIKLIIKSIKKLSTKYPEVILIITREGLFSKELKEFAEKEGISKNVIFTGDVDNPYIPLVLCDIFLHPWLGKSGVSLVLLEAMSMGKPIIATSSGGINEVIEDGKNGVLVKPNFEEISNKIQYLLENRVFAENLGRNAENTAKREFTWEKSVDKFIEIYKRIANKKR